MGIIIMFKQFILAALAAVTFAEDFKMDEAEISRQFAANAYCGHKMYETLEWQGLTSGFVWSYTIYHKSNHTEGFIGYLPMDNSIYVVFKGTDDIKSTFTDLDFFRDKYEAWPECNCTVHGGFQSSADSVKDEILVEVQRLQGIYPSA